MLSLISQAIAAVKGICELRAKLAENEIVCEHLINRADWFNKFLEEWQQHLQSSPSLSTAAPTESLELAIACLIVVIEDVRVFIEEVQKHIKKSAPSWYDYSISFANSIFWCKKRAFDMEILNRRLNNCSSDLLLIQNAGMSVQLNKQVDLSEQLSKLQKDSHQMLKSLFECSLDRLAALNGNPNIDNSGAVVALLGEITAELEDDTLKELDDDVLKRGGALSLADMSTLRDIMMTNLDRMAEKMELDNRTYLQSVKEVKELVKVTQQQADANHAAVTGNLAALMLKIDDNAFVSAQELENLGKSLSAEQNSQFAAIQGSLVELKVLPSIKQQLIDIKTTLSCAPNKADINMLITKIEGLHAVGLNELKAVFSEHNASFCRLLSKLTAADMLIESDKLEAKTMLSLFDANNQTNATMLQRQQTFERKIGHMVFNMFRDSFEDVAALASKTFSIEQQQPAVTLTAPSSLASADVVSVDAKAPADIPLQLSGVRMMYGAWVTNSSAVTMRAIDGDTVEIIEDDGYTKMRSHYGGECRYYRGAAKKFNAATWHSYKLAPTGVYKVKEVVSIPNTRIMHGAWVTSPSAVTARDMGGVTVEMIEDDGYTKMRSSNAECRYYRGGLADFNAASWSSYKLAPAGVYKVSLKLS